MLQRMFTKLRRELDTKDIISMFRFAIITITIIIIRYKTILRVLIEIVCLTIYFLSLIIH